jgi:hypothetical protein
MIEASRRIYTRRPARRRTDRHEPVLLRRTLTVLTLVAALALLLGCASAPIAPDTGSHNASGGYREACGELPGLLGDDC